MQQQGNPFTRTYGAEHELEHFTEHNAEGLRAVAILKPVSAAQVTAETGIPPRLFAMQRKRASMNDEEWREYWRGEVEADPTLAAQGNAFAATQLRLTVQLGVVRILLSDKVSGEARGQLRIARNAAEAEKPREFLDPDFLGDDFTPLYNAVVAISGGGGLKPTTDASPEEGEDPMTAFPSESARAGDEQDSGALRGDAEPTT